MQLQGGYAEGLRPATGTAGAVRAAAANAGRRGTAPAPVQDTAGREVHHRCIVGILGQRFVVLRREVFKSYGFLGQDGI